MSVHLRRLVFALAAGLLAPGTWASEGLIDVYQAALQNDPQYLAAEAQYRAALEAKPQARSLLLPQVFLSGDVGRSDRSIDGADFDLDTQGWAISLNQSLYNAEFWTRLRQADSGIAQAEAGIAAERQALIVRVAEAYFAVLAAQDNLEFTEAEREAIARQLEQSQRRFEVGLIAITDVKESQARFDQSDAQVIEAQNLLDNAREQLATVIGRYPEELTRLSPDLPLVTPDPDDIDAWVEVALEQNFDLAAARFATEVAQREIAAQRSGHYPTLDLNAAYADRDDDQLFGTNVSASTDIEDASISIEARLPLYQGGRTSSLTSQAREEFQRAQELQEAQRRETIRQARASYLNAKADIARVRALGQALESTQTAAEATEAGFEVGTRTAVDVLLTLSNVFAAERDYASARYQYVLNSLRLRQAAGTLSIEELEAIGRWLR
jgi:outer membrane protein